MLFKIIGVRDLVSHNSYNNLGRIIKIACQKRTLAPREFSRLQVVSMACFKLFSGEGESRKILNTNNPWTRNEIAFKNVFDCLQVEVDVKKKSFTWSDH